MIVGGAQENTLHNCLDLVHDFGDNVLLVCGPALGPEGDLLQLSNCQGLEVCFVEELQRAISLQDDWNAYRKIRSILRSFRPQVVHTHSAKAGILGRLAAWQESVPAIVHTVHGSPFYAGQKIHEQVIFKLMERLATCWCDRFISVSDAMTRQMISHGIAPLAKFSTIYSGFDVKAFLSCSELRTENRKKFGFSEDDIVVGKIARLFDHKGHHDVISALSKIVHKSSKVKILFVGDGTLRTELESRVTRLGLAERCVFVGLLRPDEIPGALSAVDVLVHTSLREGLARAISQAVAAAKPIVAYDLDGTPEVVIDGKTGFLIPAGDIEKLGERILQLSMNSALRSSMGSEGRRLFASQFDHLNMTKAIRSVYERVLDK
jgi:glycosyltransferase involved in cell wall biosynthesis